MTVEPTSKPHQLNRTNRDWLLTLLTAVLALMIFVFAPLQAAGIFLFQTFAIAGLLVIIGGTLIISGNPLAFGLMSIAFIANFVVFFFRLFYPCRTICTSWLPHGLSSRSLSELWSLGQCSGEAASRITE